MSGQNQITDSIVFADSTIIADTTAIDSLTAISAVADTVVEETPAWMSGLEPVERSKQPGNDSGFLLLVSLLLVVMAFNFRHLRRLLKSYAGDLLRKTYERNNVFDEHSAGDVRILLLLIVQSIVCTGILLAEAITQMTADVSVTVSGRDVLVVSAISAICYVVQFIAYRAVGYTFTTPEATRQWVRAFNASQAILGVALLIPAVLSIFYPAITAPMVVLGVGFYLILRVLFIYKGFRIFYTKFSSLFYFILYLCTLEIIPLIIVYKCSLYFVYNTL